MFYILTCGSTASVWLSRVLSRHPEIVCFHGLRSIPSDPFAGPSEGSPRDFVRTLCQLHNNAQNEIVFGAIHGFAATEIAPEIIAIDGSLTAMIRHPVTRLNSLFHRVVEVSRGTLPTPSDIFKYDKEAGTHSDDNNRSRSHDYARLFNELCQNVVNEDAFIHANMEASHIFKYERIVADRAYFRDCFETLADGCRRAIRFHPRQPGHPGSVTLECSEQYLDYAFGRGRINRKSTGPGSVSDVFAMWPDAFKSILVENLRHQGGRDAIARYAGFGYELPEAVKSALSQKASLANSGVAAHPANAPAVHNGRLSSAISIDAVVRTLPAAKVQAPGSERSDARLKPLFAVIDAERATHAAQLGEVRGIMARERDAFIARIQELDDVLSAERAMFAARLQELEGVLSAERAAFGIRINELEGGLSAERAVFATRLSEVEDVLGTERTAFGAQINELESVLSAERDAFIARMRELETELGRGRAGEAQQIAASQSRVRGPLHSGTNPS